MANSWRISALAERHRARHPTRYETLRQLA